MTKDCNHQSLRRIGIPGALKPAGHEWYECKCGWRLLIHIVASYPPDKELQKASNARVRIGRAFISEDNVEWASLELAEHRNDLLDEIKELEKFLIRRTHLLESGDGYIQQDREQVAEVQSRLLKLATAEYKNPAPTLVQLFANVLDDVGATGLDEDPIYTFYLRLACIDKEDREWQTAAIAEDPEMGKPVRLNPDKFEPHVGTQEDRNERRQQ